MTILMLLHGGGGGGCCVFRRHHSLLELYRIKHEKRIQRQPFCQFKRFIQNLFFSCIVLFPLFDVVKESVAETLSIMRIELRVYRIACNIIRAHKKASKKKLIFCSVLL